MRNIHPDFPDFLDQDAVTVAPLLLGCTITRVIDGRSICVKIVETEAYDQADAASHSFSGITPRTDVMFGPSGRLYVYFTYGMHFCCNIVTGGIGRGEAVLIHAVEPLNHVSYLENIIGRTGVETTNGPAKLCQALKIDKSCNGHDLRDKPIQLKTGQPVDVSQVVTTPRIGISKAREAMRRFYLKDNPYVSHNVNPILKEMLA